MPSGAHAKERPHGPRGAPISRRIEFTHPTGGYVDPDLGAKLVTPTGSPALELLSERERDIVHLLAIGYTNQEIAKKLFISVGTVDTHRAHIMSKLELETRAELVMFALANGVIGPEAA